MEATGLITHNSQPETDCVQSILPVWVRHATGMSVLHN